MKKSVKTYLKYDIIYKKFMKFDRKNEKSDRRIRI